MDIGTTLQGKQAITYFSSTKCRDGPTDPPTHWKTNIAVGKKQQKTNICSKNKLQIDHLLFLVTFMVQNQQVISIFS